MDDQAETIEPLQNMAATVDRLIAEGYLPTPTIRLAVGDLPVWSFPAICELFDLSAHQLIDAIVANGPAHRPDDRGIPSSWQLFREV